MQNQTICFHEVLHLFDLKNFEPILKSLSIKIYKHLTTPGTATSDFQFTK